jgi:hypothetical protein
MKTEEQTESTNEESTLDGQENAAVGTFKSFLLGVGILALVMSLWVLLPMFLTYLSEGDARPPSQIHPADPLGKSDHTIYKSRQLKK